MEIKYSVNDTATFKNERFEAHLKTMLLKLDLA
jgi:hypothetical protein